MPVAITRPKGGSRYSQRLPCSFESAESARGLVRAALSAWTLDSLVDDAVLVVSELVANAARHTRSRLIDVSVSRSAADTVLVAVVDKDTAPAVRRAPGPDETNGRGLVLVEALTERWGVTPLPRGKRVWAQLKDMRRMNRDAGTQYEPRVGAQAKSPGRLGACQPNGNSDVTREESR